MQHLKIYFSPWSETSSKFNFVRKFNFWEEAKGDTLKNENQFFLKSSSKKLFNQSINNRMFVRFLEPNFNQNNRQKIAGKLPQKRNNGEKLYRKAEICKNHQGKVKTPEIMNNN